MEKISLLKFRNLFARKSQLPRNQVSLYAPIVYGFEDKYYDACLKYLSEGVKTELCFGEYSTKVIEKGMPCSYIEALIILHNLESYPLEACYLFTPQTIE